jgi:hypothetical protein
MVRKPNPKPNPKPLAILPVPFTIPIPSTTTREPCTPEKYRQKGCGLEPCPGESWYCKYYTFKLNCMPL